MGFDGLIIPGNEKIIFSSKFNKDDKEIILLAMRVIYEKSTIARELIQDWTSPSVHFPEGQVIKIEYGEPAASLNAGIIQFSLEEIAYAMYIDNNGKAVKEGVISALVHELVHALTGKKDDGFDTKDYKGDPADYKGSNIIFANKIFRELGIPEQNSYIAYDKHGDILSFNFQYTNGAPVDNSFVGSYRKDSDGNAAYFALQRELGVTLKMFSASKHGSPLNPSFHVQTVNSYHAHMKAWLNGKFRGVATKYLPRHCRHEYMR